MLITIYKLDGTQWGKTINMYDFKLLFSPCSTILSELENNGSSSFVALGMIEVNAIVTTDQSK